jgi:hypothetical protein
MQIRIPIKTPSINHLYGHSKFGSVYLKPEAKKIRKDIEEAIHSQLGYSFENLKDIKLKVLVEISENWYTKDGSVKRVDIGNREKFLIDSIFEALGLDDKFIFEHSMKKVQSETDEFALVSIDLL